MAFTPKQFYHTFFVVAIPDEQVFLVRKKYGGGVFFGKTARTFSKLSHLIQHFNNNEQKYKALEKDGRKVFVFKNLDMYRSDGSTFSREQMVTSYQEVLNGALSESKSRKYKEFPFQVNIRIWNPIARAYALGGDYVRFSKNGKAWNSISSFLRYVGREGFEMSYEGCVIDITCSPKRNWSGSWEEAKLPPPLSWMIVRTSFDDLDHLQQVFEQALTTAGRGNK